MSQDIARIDDLRRERLRQVAVLADAAALEGWRQDVLGRSGEIPALKRAIGGLPATERADYGAAVNRLASDLQAAFEARAEALERAGAEAQLRAGAIDVTLPASGRRHGGVHPVSGVLDEICTILEGLGFETFETPEVELDAFNFQLLNMPLDHPARDMQDTFYAAPDVVLRTHTSPGQIRAMRRAFPEPCRVVLPGRCFRNEDITTRSEIQFHQVEGMAIGPDIRMSDLKGVLLAFVRRFFGSDQEIRLRASYFPFTEPSVEVDVRCTLCRGAGCRLCKHSGWLEVLGAGLMHPVVLKNGGYDPERTRGFAFGMGVERLLMLRHGVEDIRQLFQDDLRFLQQFSY